MNINQKSQVNIDTRKLTPEKASEVALHLATVEGFVNIKHDGASIVIITPTIAAPGVAEALRHIGFDLPIHSRLAINLEPKESENVHDSKSHSW